jgi:universal stress protein family protein
VVDDQGMHSTIVVGVDGHPGGRDAIALGLVVGSRAHGPLRRLLLGGTADGRVRDAACPVLVVTRGATEATSAPAAAPPAGADA